MVKFFLRLIIYLIIVISVTHIEAKQKSNIIFFLVDDLGWKDLSSQGSLFYETPAIDKLASEGMTFTEGYCSHPRCLPSRFGILTGKFPAQEKVPGGKQHMKSSEFTMAEALKKGGYTTCFIGKWHLGSKEEGEAPEDQGFDINIAGGKSGAPVSYFFPYNTPTRKGRKANPKNIIYGLEEGVEGEYLTDRLTNEAVKFIEANYKKPFFLYLSHYAVHQPLEGKEEYVKKYENKLKTLPKPDRPEYIKEGTGRTKMHQDNAVYAAMVQSIDESMGTLVRVIDSLGIADNTVIIFSSDNGGLSNDGTNKRQLATSNYPLRAGKGHLYEGGVRVPLIIKAPNITKPNSVCSQPTTNTDFYPTMLDLAGLPLRPKQHIDGISLLPALKGRQLKDRPIFWHSPTGRPHSTGDVNSTSIRTDDFKLIEFYDEGRIELYNIKENFEENKDISKTNPKQAESLLKEIHEWRKSIDAIIK